MALDWEYYKELFVAGDYRSLKEFSEENNLEYSYVQKMSAKEKWFAERKKRKEAAAEKIKAESVERSVENFYEKRRVTLGIINRLKQRAEELLEKKSCDAKDLNALASAIYRCNEVERGLIPETQSTSDLDKLIFEIRAAAETRRTTTAGRTAKAEGKKTHPMWWSWTRTRNLRVL